ncbi:MAG: hypothetical protein U1E65_04845 [Myxococcota bacterium]
MKRAISAGILVSALALGGCGAVNNAIRIIKGTIDTATQAVKAVKEVVAKVQDGSLIKAVVGADGTFKLDVPKGKGPTSIEFNNAMGQSVGKLSFPAKPMGSLTSRIPDGGGEVDLGKVSAPADDNADFSAESNPLQQIDTDGDGTDDFDDAEPEGGMS